MTMRLFFLILFALSTLVQTRASRALPITFRVKLTDGTEQTVRLCGDENSHFYLTEQGEMVLREGSTWRKATTLEVSETRRQFETMQYQRKMQYMAFQEAPSTTVPFTLPASNRPFPHHGTPHVLVIMVSFSDQDFTYSRDDIDALLNSTEYTPYEKGVKRGYGSAAQFFHDCSNGKYRPQFDVVGPFKLNKTVEYYGKNSAGQDSNRKAFIDDACQAAKENGTDFTQYDADGDGCVDLVYVYYAGYGEDSGASASTLWPCSGIHNGSTKYDGKSIYRYGISNELFAYPSYYNGTTPLLRGISVFIHEMGHTLGLPDVYPTSSWTDVATYDNQSMEFWDIMDNGTAVCNGYYPTPYSAWEREWLGWTEAIEEISQPGTYTLSPLAEGGKAYRIFNANDPARKEFYILENIANGAEAGWYYWMPGNGMLVTHINYDETSFSNFRNPNNIAGRPRWTVVPANGTLYSGYRMAEAPSSAGYMSASELIKSYSANTFPGIDAITTLENWREYNTAMVCKISNIQRDDNGTVTFDFLNDATAIEQTIYCPSTSAVYSIDGRKVAENAENLPKGIYIINGKKVIR